MTTFPFSLLFKCAERFDTRQHANALYNFMELLMRSLEHHANSPTDILCQTFAGSEYGYLLQAPVPFETLCQYIDPLLRKHQIITHVKVQGTKFKERDFYTDVVTFYLSEYLSNKKDKTA